MVTLRFAREVAAGGSRTPLTVVREARCRVPATDRALDFVIARLAGARTGPLGSWAGAPMVGLPPGLAAARTVPADDDPGGVTGESCRYEVVAYEYCVDVGGGCEWRTGYRMEMVCDSGGGGGSGDCNPFEEDCAGGPGGGGGGPGDGAAVPAAGATRTRLSPSRGARPPTTPNPATSTARARYSTPSTIRSYSKL